MDEAGIGGDPGVIDVFMEMDWHPDYAPNQQGIQQFLHYLRFWKPQVSYNVKPHVDMGTYRPNGGVSGSFSQAGII